ncbi:MAG: glycogen/starch/alpha-glucan phosphorylase [archaeon]|nr:glycogen/starch/alpha-glucan phosphorylase [archaeon]MCP8313625.1 glycogen/starch/alpha-glucan phosphorylase [archaeon]MCP8315477.1 glycogen/starch/alpha-glucan phosphorylase [archaeon]
MVIVSVTMDLALEEGHTYAGGLGILEGDKFYTAGRMGIDYAVLTLLYRGGYVDYVQHNNELIPIAQRQPIEFLDKLKPLEVFTINLKGEEVSVRPWEYTYKSSRAFFFEAISPNWVKALTDRLYIEGSSDEKFYKCIFLTRAVAKFIVNKIGVENIDYVDLQEAYATFLPLILPMNDKYRLVIHTPGFWGHPMFSRELIEKEFGYKFVSPHVVLTELGLSLAQSAFVVSAKQIDIVKKIFPHYITKIRQITNGIDLERWMSPELRKSYFDGDLDIQAFKRIHGGLKGRLINYLKHLKNVKDEESIVISCARRVVKYKRPEFITRFVEENSDLPVIYVLDGKAHPQDPDGLERMRRMHELSKNYNNVFFLPTYDVKLAKLTLQGSDLNIFTPFSGWEACGTSYMKAGVNGVPSLSSRDGGAIELIEDGLNGWFFGKDLRELIDIYIDPKAEEINKEDYIEFKSKLLSIIKIYQEDRDKFYEVGLKAIKTFTPKVDITNTLKEYYKDVVKTT